MPTIKGRELPKSMQKKVVKKSDFKKAPRTLFGEQIRYNPKAHKFSVAMGMVGLVTDIPSADLILRLFDKVNQMEGDFSISDAVNLRLQVNEEYDKIAEDFNNKITNKNK